MALPQVASITFSCIQPSTKKEITFRPFLVKEEKVLLMAKESGERVDIFNAIKSIINACVLTPGFNVDEIPIFDMEYIFIKLRSASVSNTVEFQVEDSSDGITYNLSLDLNDIEVQFPDNIERKVMINSDLGMMLKYPTPRISDKIRGLTKMADITYATINHCVDYVFDAEEIYPWAEATEKEREDWLDSLPIDAYNKINEFFERVPKIEHIVTYENSEGTEKRVYFRNLDDFFTLG